jgi:hypothetical protein
VLKIQELQIDGVILRVREPRLSDWLRARKAPEDEFMFNMLAGMVLDESGKELGLEGVLGLPLRVFDSLSVLTNQMMTGNESGPLAGTGGSSTGSQ